MRPLCPYVVYGCIPVFLRSQEPREEVVGELQWGRWESIADHLPAIYKGFKGKFYSKFDSTLFDGFPLYWVKELGLKKSRCLEDLPCGNKRCATSSPTFEWCLALSSYSSSNTTLNPLRVTLVPPFPPTFASVFLLVCCLFGLLCVFIFLCRHGA